MSEETKRMHADTCASSEPHACAWHVQVASKSEETKRYYALYNTLEEKKQHLAKEVSLLNSIFENFSKAATGPAKDKIADSVDTLNKSVQQMLGKTEQRLTEATTERDQVQGQYDELVKKQRRYYALVKEYQLECQKNEALAAAAAAPAAE